MDALFLCFCRSDEDEDEELSAALQLSLELTNVSSCVDDEKCTKVIDGDGFERYSNCNFFYWSTTLKSAMAPF